MLSDLEGQNQVLPASLPALSYTNARRGVCALHPAPPHPPPRTQRGIRHHCCLVTYHETHRLFNLRSTITDGDETAYREEVRTLTSWSRDDDL